MHIVAPPTEKSSSSIMKEKNNMIKWISSLRGLFVLFVFISHFAFMVDKSILFTIGKIGVAGFFLLSGYLAYISIQQRSFKQFLFNRFVRLYPIYWFLILLTLLVNGITHQNDWNYKVILANLTFFHQYLGFENIIGASWMLSIMVIFFAAIAIAGKNMKKMFIFFGAFAMGALTLSVLRYYFLKPFPTAIFLMSCIGFLGFFYRANESRIKKITLPIIFFEVILIVSSYLSYRDMFGYYLLSYNGALGLFFLMNHFNSDFVLLEKLGALGFTFFLGAEIPRNLIIYLFPTLEQNLTFLAIHFILCFLFSLLVTKFIERPILQYAKRIEKEKIT